MALSGHWFLLKEMVRRDFRGRYAGSILGFLWSFLPPLWQLVLFNFVFATVLKVSPVGERTDSFAIFLFAGLLPWMALNEGLVRSTTAVTDNANLVKKLTFPAELLVLSVVLAALLHQAIALGVFLVALLAMGELSLPTLPLLILALPLQFALTLGLGLLFGALQVVVRDIAHLLGMLVTVWFYLTPIVYPLGIVPDRYHDLIELNPLTALVGLYRAALLGSDAGGWRGIWLLAGAAAVLLCAGLWLFRRLKGSFADDI